MKVKLHPDFKINNQSFTLDAFNIYVENQCNSNEIYRKEVGSFLKVWLNESPFILVQTSGSTGKPKEIKLQKAHMINSALATGKYFNLPEKTKALLCLSANYIAGKMMLVRAMVLGWNLCIVPTSGAPLESNTLDYDFCAMVPLQVENSLTNLGKIKQLIIGGAPISATLLPKLQHLSTKCYATYGMTETVTHVAIKPLNQKFATHVFQALPQIKFQQDDKSCLVIDAPNLTHQTIVTNDVVHLISETQFEWLGRYDNIINSGGVKLYPEKIEQKLAFKISERLFVSSVSDEKLGERLVLIIESSQSSSKYNRSIRQASLFKFEIPKEVYCIAQFQETPTGKINRKETLKQVFT